jgi:hypothetical protein
MYCIEAKKILKKHVNTIAYIRTPVDTLRADGTSVALTLLSLPFLFYLPLTVHT